MEFFWFWAGALAAGAYWLILSGMGWVIRTGGKVEQLEREVGRLAGRLDRLDKGRS